MKVGYLTMRTMLKNARAIGGSNEAAWVSLGYGVTDVPPKLRRPQHRSIEVYSIFMIGGEKIFHERLGWNQSE